MKVGIFFGGPSREREISFSGGRTVYENLDRALFEPVPVFVDSLGNFILIDWHYFYKEAIRGFYPPAGVSNASSDFNVYIESLGKLSDAELIRIISVVGQSIRPADFKKLFDFAIIAMHGPYCEDGSIQGLLEWYHIPYSSCGILSSAIGIDKIVQNQLMARVTGQNKKMHCIGIDEWKQGDKKEIFDRLKQLLGFPFVAKAPHQGSSIGVAIINQDDTESFTEGVNRCFFAEQITHQQWSSYSRSEQIAYLNRMANLSEGIGFPVVFREEAQQDYEEAIYYHPEALQAKLNDHFSYSQEPVLLYSIDSEETVLFEEFIAGKEFSCGVIQDEQGRAIPLLPTEIVKMKEVFDFSSKYQAGATRKVLPIEAPDEAIRQIQQQCSQVFEALQFNVCARIDGFLTPDGRVLLHDPNTVPGMSPTSLIFRQFSEIGLNVTQALTYLIRTSLQERAKTGKRTYVIRSLMEKLDLEIAHQRNTQYKRIRVAVIFGGFGNHEEANASLATARKVYGKLAASAAYLPVPVFLAGAPEAPLLYTLPVNMLFKDGVQEIHASLLAAKHPVVAETVKLAEAITRKYAGAFPQSAAPLSVEELASSVHKAFVALKPEGADMAIWHALPAHNLELTGPFAEQAAVYE